MIIPGGDAWDKATTMSISASSKAFMVRITLTLLLGITIFVAMHCYSHAVSHKSDWLFDMFDLDSEKNVPTWYSSLLWFLVSASAFVAYFVERLIGSLKPDTNRTTSMRWGFIWLIIGLAFLVASADEVAMIHEQVGSAIQEWRHTSSSVEQLVALGQQHQTSRNSPWILYYLPPLTIFAVVAVSFLWNRLKSKPTLVMLCMVATSCFAISIAADHYQGQSWERRDSIGKAMHLDGASLTELSIVIEESLEQLGCLCLILSFATYSRELVIENYQRREL